MPDKRRSGPGFSAVGALAAFAGAAGIAGGVTLLYRSMAAIMATEGAFVASGGPYEISHPAPHWVWLVPVSIMAGIALGGLSLVASFRGWGINPVLFAWMGLFIALGWNFLRLGILDRPEGLTSAWGWWVSGIVFWAMGLTPAVTTVRFVRGEWRRMAGAADASEPRAWWAGALTTTPTYVFIQLIGVAVGIAGALVLFGRVAVGY